MKRFDCIEPVDLDLIFRFMCNTYRTSFWCFWNDSEVYLVLCISNKVGFRKNDEVQDNRSVSSRISDKGVSIIFSLKQEVGALVEALKLFRVGLTFNLLVHNSVIEKLLNIFVFSWWNDAFWMIHLVHIVWCLCRKNLSASFTSRLTSRSEEILTLRSSWIVAATMSRSGSWFSCWGNTRTLWRYLHLITPLWTMRVGHL